MMGYEENVNPISDTSNYLTKTFFRMFLGLLATAVAAAYTYYSGLFVNILSGATCIILCIAEIAVVIAFSAGFRKFSSATVTALFFVYAILTGVTFSTIFLMFDLQSIVYTFIGTAAIFGVMALIGKTTKADLTKFGTILMVTLVVGLVVSLINIFLGNAMVDFVLDWVILLVFMGFTVYDMNKITHMRDMGITAENDKLYVYGAMELYLDFINMFLRILYLFGGRRRNK